VSFKNIKNSYIVVVMKNFIFWDITPCSRLKVKPTFQRNQGESCWQGEFSFPPSFTLVSCWAYSSTLKMEATCSSETSVGFQRTTRHYFPEDSTLHSCSATQEMIHLLLIRNLIAVLRKPPLLFISCSFKIHFNIILPFTRRSSVSFLQPRKLITVCT
jgi:hypothetical protein